MKYSLLLSFLVVGIQTDLLAYTIKNNTNYPVMVELTTIYQTIDNKYHESTIQLNFTPSESKNVPVGWMRSMRAVIDEKGVLKTTPVMDGKISQGNSSGLPTSWIISPAQENQFGQNAYMIQMAL